MNRTDVTTKHHDLSIDGWRPGCSRHLIMDRSGRIRQPLL